MGLLPKIRQANKNLDQWMIIREGRYEFETVHKLQRIISGTTTHKLHIETFLSTQLITNY